MSGQATPEFTGMDAGESATTAPPAHTTPTHIAQSLPRAWRSTSSWLRLLLVLFIGLGLDLGSKYWAFDRVIPGYPVQLDRKTLLEDPDWNVPHHPGVHALPWKLLDFQLVINRGAVFGIGANRRFFFIAFTIGALMAGLWVFSRTQARSRLAHLAIGLILAGGIGNLYDRIVFGVVRDFLHMLPGRELPFGWTWPGGSPEMFPWVFNVADTMLLTGMGLLIIHMHRNEKRHAAEKKAEANVGADGAR